MVFRKKIFKKSLKLWFRFCFIFSVTQQTTKGPTFCFYFCQKREKLYFVVARVAAITLSLKNPKFIIMENFKREPVEEPVAKRRRLEPWIAEEIIQNQQQLIESLRAEIAIKNKIIQELRNQEKNYFESLPDECLLKIFSFLSNYDVLRRVAR